MVVLSDLDRLRAVGRSSAWPSNSPATFTGTAIASASAATASGEKACVGANRSAKAASCVTACVGERLLPTSSACKAATAPGLNGPWGREGCP